MLERHFELGINFDGPKTAQFGFSLGNGVQQNGLSWQKPFSVFNEPTPIKETA